MKKTNQWIIPTVILLLFAALLNTAFGAQTNEAGLNDDAANKPSTALVQDLKKISAAEAKTLFEDSYFHRFMEGAKNNLSTTGQQLTAVISQYSEIPSELASALKNLSDGKGPGHLVKIILLFMLLIAIGFGAERLFNIFIKKHKQQLQSTIPDSFLQLIARLSARTVLELISLTVFALTIVGIYLLFYPAPNPLHELAMIYLPQILIMRLAFILLSALYSPAAPHMRVAPQNCMSAATYFMGFMTFIIVSLFVSKTLLLLRSHGMSEGVFLLLYAHLGLFQFFILLAILWMDRTRITRLVMKRPTDAGSPSSSSGSKIKRLWFPLACAGLLGFELLWQVNLILYQKDLVLPLLLTILSIPFGLLLFSIGNRLLLIASGHTELLDPRIVNQDILPKDMDLSALSAIAKVALPPEPVSARRADGAADRNEPLFMRNLPLIRNLMGILIACALFFWVMNLWGLDLPLGRSVAQSAASIFATLLLAYVVWEICRTIIDRKLEEDRHQSGGQNTEDIEDMEEGTEGSRKGTLLTLLRKVILTLIGVIVILITLNAVGVNIGPLLAGAGVLGIAVGFGSQTLVRTFFQGFFS